MSGNGLRVSRVQGVALASARGVAYRVRLADGTRVAALIATYTLHGSGMDVLLVPAGDGVAGLMGTLAGGELVAFSGMPRPWWIGRDEGSMFAVETDRLTVFQTPASRMAHHARGETEPPARQDAGTMDAPIPDALRVEGTGRAPHTGRRT